MEIMNNIKNNIIYTLISFILVIFTFHMLGLIINKKSFFKIKEGLENNIQTMVYKNSGAIDNLKENIDKVMKQVNEIILKNDKQTTKINELQKLEKKYEKVANKAEEIADENKNRLLQLANQAKKKSEMMAKESDKIPSP
jgi:sensor histidine kinase YesM